MRGINRERGKNGKDLMQEDIRNHVFVGVCQISARDNRDARVEHFVAYALEHFLLSLKQIARVFVDQHQLLCRR